MLDASLTDSFTQGLLTGLKIIAWGILPVGAIFYAIKSAFLPESGKYYAVEFLNQFSYVIGGSNEGYSLNDPRGKKKDDAREWDIIEDKNGMHDSRTRLQKRYNIYFLWYGFYKIKTYEIKYRKMLDKSQMQEDDVIVWQDEGSGDGKGKVMVGRVRDTNYIPFRAGHANLTNHAYTGHGLSEEQVKTLKEQKIEVPEMIGIDPRTNNIIQAVNPAVMIYKIDDYVSAFFGAFDARMRAFTGKTSILNLNQVDSEQGPGGGKIGISEFMKFINDADPVDKTDGVIVNYGVKLHVTNFVGFDGTTEGDKKVIGSINDVFVASQEAKAAAITGKGKGDAYENEAMGKARGNQALLEAEGWIEVKEGKTTKRKPDPNIAVFAKAIEKTGVNTLVFGENPVATYDIGKSTGKGAVI